MSRFLLRNLVVGAVAASVAGSDVARAQFDGPTRSWLEATSGTPMEEYLRALQLDTARARPYPQTIRPFGAGDAARMLRAGVRHPWSAAVDAPRAGTFTIDVLRPAARAIANSSFAFGFNDGAVWAGRGVTMAVDAGFRLRAGPLSARVQPTVVWAQNASFELFDEARVGDARFRDGADPGSIDAPQRFGDRALRRLDYGTSEIRLDVGPFAAGVTNAPETWGPATTHPLVLGYNAPGFAHAFVGTARPASVWIGRVHARMIVGRLDESAWSPAPDSLRRRTAAGLVATFTPRGLDHLELGATRFFHRRWVPGEVPWNAWKIPLTGLAFKENRKDVDDTTSARFLADNQLASLFFRWTLPAARAEVYGEYMRNDAALDAREILVEPDHQSAYLVGVRALLPAPADRMRVLRIEWVNARITHLNRVRAQGLLYSHGQLLQGHTNQGEVLGSAAVQGGGGAVVGWDAYDPRGMTRLELHRIARNALPALEGAPSLDAVDVQHVARAERVGFRGASDLTLGAAAVWEANRNFRGDAFDLQLSIGYRFGASSRRTTRRTPSPNGAG